MKRKLKVHGTELIFGAPEFWTNPNRILICVGDCKKRAFASRAGKTVTFFPVLGPTSPKRMREVLDAIKVKGLKIHQLEIFLSAALGSKRFTFEKSAYDKYLECYSFKVFLQATYVRCSAMIRQAGKTIKFRIDLPVGVYQQVEGTPDCCAERKRVTEMIGDYHEPPAEVHDQIARDLYEEAKKKEEVKKSDMLDEMLKGASRSKFGKKIDWDAFKKLGLDYEYDGKLHDGDRPVIKIKPKWGW